jgi:autotransporter-associated beta strand protein
LEQMKPKNPLLALLLGAAFLAAPCANAADGTWTLNNNGNWSLGTNWSGGTVADGTDFSAFFSDVISGNRNITVDSARIIGHIYAQDTSHNYAIIGANTLTLDTSSGPSILDVVSGRTLTISAPLTINDGLQVNGAGTTSLTGAITLGASQTWDNSGTLSISGIIGDGGNAYSLTKTGTGRLLLLNSASNQGFSGGLTVNGGELEFRRSDNGTTNTTLSPPIGVTAFPESRARVLGRSRSQAESVASVATVLRVAHSILVMSPGEVPLSTRRNLSCNTRMQTPMAIAPSRVTSTSTVPTVSSAPTRPAVTS